ncbi:DNA-deoxyinosine glycosylase [Antarcticibacterium sp. 1MA-6-2]|uniref:DNA-deoxyinosine glycosylase n=1 Tax=Antarcticibacterium sp. 1MA-6-2 TaxID=2908210 RepID=UPI001F259FB2|nr:DNA-deoxyinosine glycosylase [Antarcticibacterium sp. 1MA-6-2]UJH90981.1 DNA-deoxyinosine glycosylase [Antarcticibacterium sp. 1MA-6-2]
MPEPPVNYKTSFPPISNSETEILILGTLPGDRSLEMGEYFAHPRNRFWKIIAAITNNPLPEDYLQKRDLLYNTKIGVWNVLHKAHRKGSLDSAIQNEVPNDISRFIRKHTKLKVIAFDGLKAEALFDKHFTRRSDIKYILLPACSPANARFNLIALCDRWKEILLSLED